MVARLCLNVLRARRSGREEPSGVHLPDPIVSRADGVNPEDEALPADSVGLALASSCTRRSAGSAARSRRRWER